MKEINLRLAEGLEAKRLVHEKNIQLSIQSNLIDRQQLQINNGEKQLATAQENNAIAQGKVKAANDQLDQCDKDRREAVADKDRIKKGRNTWRTIASGATVSLAVVLYIVLQ